MAVRILNKLWILAGLVALNGCAKLVTVPPPVTELSSENVYSTNSTASGVMTGVYIGFTLGPALSPGGASLYRFSLEGGLSADELTLYGGSTNSYQPLLQFYQNNLMGGGPGTDPQTIWFDCYSGIYKCNQALEKLSGPNGLTTSVRQQLTGEAEFMRAFFYFYLVTLYGNAPLILHSNYGDNVSLARGPQASIYRQIIADLLDAANLLTSGYVGGDAMSPTAERVRPNKWAAKALLARVYLYTGAYDSAEIQSSAVIGNTSLYDTTSLNSVFLKNSREAIWQVQPVNTGWSTPDAQIFVLSAAGPTTGNFNPVYLSPNLLGSFEQGDARRQNWIDSVIVNDTTYYYPFKYKSATYNAPVTEYEMVLRLGEQYLIRAEARAKENKIQEAQADLNIIRKRAGLSNTTANDQASLLAAIAHERQVELFTEWGNRWLDLKRTQKVDSVMGMPGDVCAKKGGTWKSDWQWYPVPVYDIVQDPNLTQNSGY